MSYQYRTCTKYDHESSCAHNWCARKEKIACIFKLEDPKFDSYPDLSVFNYWLANMECYFDLYEFFEATRVLFARRKLVGSVRI